MIRFIFDSFGNSHQDIFLKVNAGIIPDELSIADFYFIPEFLEYESAIEDGVEWKKACFKRYLEHLIDLINLNLDKTHLVFDLSDQYISAIRLEKFNRGKIIFYKTAIVYSVKYHGWGINYKFQQSEFIETDWTQDGNHNWEITQDNLLKGLKWSIENLGCKIPVIK